VVKAGVEDARRVSSVRGKIRATDKEKE